MMRRLALIAAALVVISACGGGELSLTEYVERVNEAAAEAGESGAELLERAEAITDFSPRDMADGLEFGLERIRRPLQEAVDAIEPPQQIADLHDLMWGWHARFIEIEAALLERVKAADDTYEALVELSDVPEMDAYRAGLVEGKQVCTQFQEDLDATAARGVFADTPWIPGEMKEVVEAALGCAFFPEDPNEVYRFSAP